MGAQPLSEALLAAVTQEIQEESRKHSNLIVPGRFTVALKEEEEEEEEEGGGRLILRTRL